jgi:hypothetical protein
VDRGTAAQGKIPLSAYGNTVDESSEGENHFGVASLSDGDVRRSGAPMKIRRSFALLGAIALALAAVLAPAPAGASGSRNAHFIILSSDPSPTATAVVIATGPIHARGTDITVNPSRDRFVFPKGAIAVLHQTKHSHDSFDPVTCYGTHTETGTYQVTGGTRAYDDARGNGTFKVTVTFVGCSQTAPPQVFQLRVDAFGPLSLGR